MAILRFRRDRRQPGTPAAAARPRFANPHGIATPAKLAELAAQAEAERQTATMAQPPWGPWDQPGNFPEAMRARNAGGWYGWDTTAMDVPPAHHRRYAPDPLTSPLSRAPLSFTADFAQLPVFRAACRAAGHAPGGLVRATQRPALPDFRIGEMMHAKFAGMLAMHPGMERAA